MKYNFRVGVEIEGILNKDIHNIKKGGRHEGKKIKGLRLWKAENDGSVHNYNEFKNNSEIELITSKPFREKRNFFKSLEHFKNYFSKNGRYELNEVLSFNKSCGSHVHISIDNLKFNNFGYYPLFLKTRKLFFKLIRNSNINKKAKDEILFYYNRGFARILTKHNFKVYKVRKRDVEFNFLSEQQNKGLEWRSINTIGLKTWKEFKEFFEIVWKCLMFLNKNISKFKIKKEIKINSENFKNHIEILCKKDTKIIEKININDVENV